MNHATGANCHFKLCTRGFAHCSNKPCSAFGEIDFSDRSTFQNGQLTFFVVIFCTEHGNWRWSLRNYWRTIFILQKKSYMFFCTQHCMVHTKETHRSPRFCRTRKGARRNFSVWSWGGSSQQKFSLQTSKKDKNTLVAGGLIGDDFQFSFYLFIYLFFRVGVRGEGEFEKWPHLGQESVEMNKQDSDIAKAPHTVFSDAHTSTKYHILWRSVTRPTWATANWDTLDPYCWSFVTERILSAEITWPARQEARPANCRKFVFLNASEWIQKCWERSLLHRWLIFLLRQHLLQDPLLALLSAAGSSLPWTKRNVPLLPDAPAQKYPSFWDTISGYTLVALISEKHPHYSCKIHLYFWSHFGGKKGASYTR